MFSSDKWFGAEAGFYNGVATQSLRFDRSSSSYLIKENTSVTSTQKWTLSVWIKRSTLGSEQGILGSSATAEYIRFESNDSLRYRLYTSSSQRISMITSTKFRDTANWFHLVCAVDLSNTTDNDKAIIYVNGTRQPLSTNITTSTDTYNSKMLQNGGHYWNLGRYSGYFGGYMSDVHLIDGQQLDPTYFAETKNGVWIAKEYTGTYGNSGARLQFKQTGSSAGASGIGADTSGNGNHFNAYNVSSYDSNMPDSPENNFCTLNPILATAQTDTATYSQGNLQYTATNAYDTAIGTIGVHTGKWYYETKLVGNGNQMIGLRASPHDQATSFLGQNTSNSGIGHYRTVGVYNESSGGDSLFTAVDGDVIGIAFDADNGYVWFSKNGSFYGTVDTSSNRYTLASWTSGEFLFPAQGYRDSRICNFGQDASFVGTFTGGDVGTETDGNGIGAFKYAPPTGYLALCSSNLPDTTLSPNQDEQAEDHFNIVKYTGNGYPTSNGQTISGVGFQSDFTWIKDMDRNGYNHYLLDSSRGATKALRSNVSNGENTEGASLTSWNADGFVLGANNEVNYQNDEFVAWNWKANGGTTTTNDASATGVGDIDSVIQANTTAGFSIVTFTGNGSDSTNTIAHGLGAKPSMYIVKDRDTNVHGHFMVYHKDTAPSNHYNLFMSGYGTNAANNAGFGSSDPATTTTFKPAVTAYTNNNGSTYVAWLWTEIKGFSRFGTYDGRDGGNVFIYTGFRPSFFMCKNTETAGTNWLVFDDVRDTANAIELELNWNNTDQQNDNGREIDFVSNGIKIRTSDNNNISSGDAFIYMAFARQPFKFSNAF